MSFTDALRRNGCFFFSGHQAVDLGTLNVNVGGTEESGNEGGMLGDLYGGLFEGEMLGDLYKLLIDLLFGAYPLFEILEIDAIEIEETDFNGLALTDGLIETDADAARDTEANVDVGTIDIEGDFPWIGCT